ncbi:hypothetical protein VKT23_015704 [Stygiomarasmius scandens]|uniref:Cytochrome P450 n=1 Tax=Marasmiellus scandens TaxID=2682957 RepID=A0ABR1IX16_9AGAR
MVSNPDFSREELLDNVTVLFIAGHDTTAGGLTSVMYYLAKHPVCQEKARAEFLSVLGKTQDPNLDTGTRMPYVFACIREAMRMNNPSNATLPRSADTTTQLAAYVILPKTLMSFNIAATHHREDVYPNHSIYDPERFTSQDSASQNGLAVFGIGLRQCPARNFAMWELRTAVALLLRTYEWNLPKDSKHTDRVHNGFSFSTNLNFPVGVSVDIRRREKAYIDES